MYALVSEFANNRCGIYRVETCNLKDVRKVEGGAGMSLASIKEGWLVCIRKSEYAGQYFSPVKSYHLPLTKVSCRRLLRLISLSSEGVLSWRVFRQLEATYSKKGFTSNHSFEYSFFV